MYLTFKKCIVTMRNNFHSPKCYLLIAKVNKKNLLGNINMTKYCFKCNIKISQQNSSAAENFSSMWWSPTFKIAFCFHALNNRKKMLQVSGSRYWISFFHTDSCKSTDCVNFALQFRKQNRVNWVWIYITTYVSLCKKYGGVNLRLELEIASPFSYWPVNHECHVKQLNLFTK